jgi:hypothetical protein
MDSAALRPLVRAQYPRCPGMYVAEIADRLAGRECPVTFLKQEIAMMAEAVIRHQLTDYDQLRTRFELSPEEARLAVADEISDWLAEWQAS